MSRSAPFLCSGLRFSQYAERSLALSYAWCARAPVSVRLRACSYYYGAPARRLKYKQR